MSRSRTGLFMCFFHWGANIAVNSFSLVWKTYIIYDIILKHLGRTNEWFYGRGISFCCHDEICFECFVTFIFQVKDLTKFLDPSGLGVISFEDFHRGITAISNGGEIHVLTLSCNMSLIVSPLSSLSSVLFLWTQLACCVKLWGFYI